MNPQATTSTPINPSINRCIEQIIHSITCYTNSCRIPDCTKMKNVIQHTQECKKRQHGTCPVCKQFIALCCFHAKRCVADDCNVPQCGQIRYTYIESENKKELEKLGGLHQFENLDDFKCLTD